MDAAFTEQSRISKLFSQECMDRFNRDLTDFVRGFVNMGSPLHDRNETVVGSRCCKAKKKKAKSIASVGKIITSVFRETKGILLIDFLEKGRAITSELDQLEAEIHKKLSLKREKNPSSSGQRNCVQEYVGDGKTAGFGPSTLFS
ncbi:hypothetical protein TNCV_4916531 [Trichonephila clavipes]|nr:hypothetical protein TNCV_4916531 [Trichonephila clavipes]